MKISLRFKIFERDRFTCQYCGRKPPMVVLHVDHIFPKSKGGKDDEINLITSCQECNLGKRDKVLKNPQRPNVKQEIENLKEAEQQIKEYYRYLKKLVGHKENNPVIDLICKVWNEQSAGESSVSELGKNGLQKSLRRFCAEDIIEAIKITWSACHIENEQKWKYMWGVAKNLKLRRDNPELAQHKEERNKIYFRLLSFWQNRPRGSGYLPRERIFDWLALGWTEQQIMKKMEMAGGMWATLKNNFDFLYDKHNQMRPDVSGKHCP